MSRRASNPIAPPAGRAARSRSIGKQPNKDDASERPQQVDIQRLSHAAQLLETVSRSRQGYQELIDSMDDVMFSLLLDGQIRAVNRRFAEFTGLPFSEIVGRNLSELVDEPTREAAERALPRFLERRYWQGVLCVQLKKTGGACSEPATAGPDGIGAGRGVHYFDCTLRAMVKNGEVVGVSGLAKDVTYERESEARFTQLFETLQEGVYFTTPEGKFIDANPALVMMLGYENKEELLRVNVSDLYAQPVARAELLRELEQQVTVCEREIVLRRKDGRPVTCLDTSTAIRDSHGRVIRYQGTLVDITQRREMEQKLHQEQEFARRLVESFPDMIVVLDTEGRYTYVSARLREQLGYEPEEILGKSLGERTHPDDRVALVEMLREMVQGKRNYGTVEYRTLHKDGTWRIMRATSSPLCDACGKITGVIASARDMTELKRLEQQVSQSEKLAAMGQMIAGVAHELNNPLTAILGINDLLRERAADEGMRRQLDLIQRQARRAAEIVQNLLTFSRPRAPRRTRINLHELLLHTVQLHEFSLHVNNIRIHYQVEAENLPIVGDSNQLMQVFLNLIVNAEQAVREIRDRGTLRVAAREQDEKIVVSFQDDGPGIPPAILPRIFDPFFTTKRPGRGTGLGLSICMAIMREHGGTIEARSSPEGGALFTLTFPTAKASQLDAPGAEPSAFGAEELSKPPSNKGD